jgi:hypothetical protein
MQTLLPDIVQPQEEHASNAQKQLTTSRRRPGTVVLLRRDLSTYTVSLHADIATKDCAAVGGSASASGPQEPFLPGLQGQGDLLL